MRPTRRLLLIGLFCAACAPPPPSSAPASSWAEDAAQIRAALTESTEAWNRADLRGHLAAYDGSTTFMTGTGPRTGVSSIEEIFLKSFWQEGRPKQRLRFEQMETRALGGDAALSTGHFILSGGGAPDQTGWFSVVWLRTPAGWRIVHDHSS